MIPQMTALPVFSELALIFPVEDLTRTGFTLYPIVADEGTKDLLARYQAATSDEERVEMEKMIICCTCFQGNVDSFNAYMDKRSELVQQIGNIRKKLDLAVDPTLIKELGQLETQLVQFEQETASSIWMKESEMEVHREYEERGFPLPPIWNTLTSLVRKEYCLMANTIYGEIQMAARTTQGCDEFRFDMLRYATCLLKYYGFTCANSRIKHPLQEVLGKYFGGFFYGLLNPTWEHLENEVRQDLKTFGLEEDQIPARYPDTPTVAPSPLKVDNETHQKAVQFFMLGTLMRKEDDKLFF